MGLIRYKNLPYGGGSIVEANKTGATPSENLITLTIDGVTYDTTELVFCYDDNGSLYTDSTKATAVTGDESKLYIATNTGKQYRYNGSAFSALGVNAINDLSDVTITSASDGQALEYDATAGKWKNVAKKAADTPTFSEASTRANISGSGETMATILGKIKKWFSDLKDLAFIAKDGTSSTKYLRGDGTWQTFPTIPTKVSDLTDDVVSGHYLPLTGGTLTGNLNVSNNGASDTALYVRGNSQGAYIGFHNANGGTTYGYYGVRNDNKPYFYSGTGKRIVLDDELPTKLSDLTNDLNKIKDIGNGQDTTFAYSKAGLNYDDVSWLAAWNGYELRALDKNKLSIGYVPIRKDYDTYTQLAKWYGGTTEPPYVRIAFPTGISTVWTMLNIEILFRQNYANDLGGKILINCHHNAVSPYAWVGNAFVSGFVRKSDIKVYGSDGRYLYIKGIDSYTTLSIEKVLVGDTARSIDLTSTTIDYVSALPSTYQTFTMYTDVDSSNIANQSVDKATKDGDGNTISSTYLKNSNVLMKNGDANVSPAGYRNIGGTNDYITLSEAGTYLITAWAMFKGGTGNKAVLICRASDNAAYGQSWESSTINQSYPKTFTCFHVATVTSTTLYFRARVYTENTDVYGGISGGIYAIKVS